MRGLCDATWRSVRSRLAERLDAKRRAPEEHSVAGAGPLWFCVAGREAALRGNCRGDAPPNRDTPEDIVECRGFALAQALGSGVSYRARLRPAVRRDLAHIIELIAERAGGEVAARMLLRSKQRCGLSPSCPIVARGGFTSCRSCARCPQRAVSALTVDDVAREVLGLTVTCCVTDWTRQASRRSTVGVAPRLLVDWGRFRRGQR